MYFLIATLRECIASIRRRERRLEKARAQRRRHKPGVLTTRLGEIDEVDNHNENGGHKRTFEDMNEARAAANTTVIVYQTH